MCRDKIRLENNDPCFAAAVPVVRYFKNLYELAAYLSGVMNVQSTYCYTSYLLPLHHIELPAPDMSNTRPPTLST